MEIKVIREVQEELAKLKAKLEANIYKVVYEFNQQNPNIDIDISAKTHNMTYPSGKKSCMSIEVDVNLGI